MFAIEASPFIPVQEKESMTVFATQMLRPLYDSFEDAQTALAETCHANDIRTSKFRIVEVQDA